MSFELPFIQAFLIHSPVGNEKGNKMLKGKYFLIFTDNESLSHYIEENSIEGYLTIESDHLHFESDDYIIDEDDVDVIKGDERITVYTNSCYYTFSLSNIEELM